MTGVVAVTTLNPMCRPALVCTPKLVHAASSVRPEALKNETVAKSSVGLTSVPVGPIEIAPVALPVAVVLAALNEVPAMPEKAAAMTEPLPVTVLFIVIVLEIVAVPGVATVAPPVIVHVAAPATRRQGAEIWPVNDPPEIACPTVSASVPEQVTVAVTTSVVVVSVAVTVHGAGRSIVV